MHDPNNPQMAPTSPESAEQGLSSPSSHKRPRWALYARSEGSGIAAQLEALRAYADTQGARVVAELVDVGPVGAGRDRAIELARAGGVEAVAAYQIGQLGTTAEALEQWLDAFEDTRARLLVLRGPGDSTPANLSSAKGRLAVRMLGAFLSFEAEFVEELERRYGLESPGEREGRPVDDDEA